MRHVSRSVSSVLVVALCAAQLGVYNPPLASAASAGVITGFAFDDPNQNGIKGTSERGLLGVQVTATSTNGTVASTTTAADGSYTFTGLTGRHRIEFATPAGLFPSRVGSGAGVVNGSAVQFADADAGADVHAAFANPAEYCQSNPDIALTCMYQTPSSGAALKKTPYNANQTATSGTQVSTIAAVGSTFGVAWNPIAKKIYQSAFFKRGIAVGPSGLGAIYVADPAGGGATLLTTIPNTGADPRPILPDWTRDAESFGSVFKIGLGDIDMADDFSTLYAVNLNDNGVYSVAINADGSAGAVSGPATPGVPADCTASQFHVFGLGIKGTSGYLSGVCSGPAATDLKGYLFPFTASGTVTTIGAAEFTFPMNYKHGQALGWTTSTNEAEDGNFLPWDAVTSEVDSDVRLASTTNIAAAQAQITDVEFTDSGSLVLGVRDRFGDQTGQGLLGAAGGSTAYRSAAAGDILLVCGTPGAWVLESNGSCGGATGTGVGNLQGPGGGEFYGADNYNTGHEEISLGSLARLPGSGEIISAVFDPDSVRSQGTLRLSNGGARVGANTLSATDEAGTFGKANGLGDLELLCDLAPLEIGNRVWTDEDGDGVQDPADPGIDGVTVELYKDAVLVGTTTTANGGQYYFNETNVTIGGTPGIVPAMNYEIRIPNATGASQQSALAKLSPTTTDAAGAGNDVRDSDAAVATGETTAVIPVPATSITRAGANNHTFDAGFVPRYSLGNRVWMDSGVGGGTMNDGIQNGTEPGISGVTLKLFAADGSGVATGTALATQVTDINGYYRFDNLAPGNYVVVVDTVASATPLASVGSSSGAASANSNVDRDDNGSDTALPAGSVLPGGIASSVISLGTDGSEPTTETDLPSGGSPDSALNEYSNQTVDFGFVPTYSLGNRVWFDTNNNGTMDATEVGAPGVSVTLLDSTVTPIAGRTTTTDADGRYRFDGLSAGTYSVRIDAANFATGGVLADYASSTPTEAAPNDDVDRNDNGVQPSTPNGALTAGIVSGAVLLGPLPEPTGETDVATTPGDSPDARSNLTVDFGFYKTAVGNTLWHDTDNDGLIDAGEPRLEGVVVNLVDAVSGAIIGTATTNAQGEYQISKTTTGAPLPVGTSVKISIPSAQTPLSGLEPSDPTGTADSFNHGTTVGANVESAAFTLTPGATAGGQTVNNATATTTNPTLDFGFNSPLASLGDRVWVDTDRDGQQDVGESGVANVTVQLRNSSGAVIATTTTDTNGLYKFSNLQPGTYSVRFVPTTLPTGATFTTTDSGADASDSDANQTTGVTGSYTLAKRQFIPTVDAGIVTPLASIGDTVWLDSNNNGIQDAGEAGVPGVAVELLDASGAVVKTVNTDANGKYLFDQLTPGAYSIRFVPGSLPSGTAFTTRDVGGDDATDSDADPSTGRTGTYTLAPGDNVRTVDAGIIRPSNPVVVPPSTIAPTPTQAPVSTAPPSTVPVSTIAPTAPTPTTVVEPKGRLTSVVFVDANDNGVQDPGEAPVAGAGVRVVGPGGVVRTAVTDANGRYDLSGLAPGDYTVTITGSGLTDGFSVLGARSVTVRVLANEVSAPVAEFRIASRNTLAFTGASRISGMLQLSLLLIAAGAVLVAAGRRRRHD